MHFDFGHKGAFGGSFKNGFLPVLLFSLAASVLICPLILMGQVTKTPSEESQIGQQSLIAETISEENWKRIVPKGKEVDAIVGDFVLANEYISCVIAAPLSTRHANLTMRGVGGYLIDISSRDSEGDQLGYFSPGGRQFKFEDRAKIKYMWMDKDGNEVPANEAAIAELRIEGSLGTNKSAVTQIYRLGKTTRFLEVESIVKNSKEKEEPLLVADAIRADRTFEFGKHEELNMYWAYDSWFFQALGIASDELKVVRSKRRGVVLEYHGAGGDEEPSRIMIAPGKSFAWKRKIIPAQNHLQLIGLVKQLRGDVSQMPVSISFADDNGPVADADVKVRQDENEIGKGRTSKTGQLSFQATEGDLRLTVESNGRPKTEHSISVAVDGENEFEVRLETLGKIAFKVTDQDGKKIPCKVAFLGVRPTRDPDFGPDSRAQEVKNLRYDASGEFSQQLGPGEYEVLISHGTEYDAIIEKVEVKRGETVEVEASLQRSVSTEGWVSTEYHSHSTQSGDNTSEQLGRVLNLLAEHLEFAPCTEHNRVDSYEPHLKALGCEALMATCCGMELTGSMLPVNHQNTFPLKHKPRSQNGGGPDVDKNPYVQIERLKLWDDESNKLMQMNHPNLVQVLGDRDGDGSADEGYEKMLSMVDVIEVHPLSTVFDETTKLPAPRSRGNTIFHWLQMLNEGYRIPGVVNTDAHYNFHGSGWLRNYVRSSTDDPSKIDTQEMIKNSRAGAVIMTNGPFLEVSLVHSKGEAGVGEEVKLEGDNAKLKVRVQCPNWLDINRIQVLLNGRRVENLDFDRRANGNLFGNGVVKFDQEIDLTLDKDTHIIVVAAGQGLRLGRVMGPEHGEKMPIAVSNPIFVDIGDDGFVPNKDRLGAPFLHANDKPEK